MPTPFKSFVFQHGQTRLRFTARRLLIAGFTGRNMDAVRQHVEELIAEGVPRPERVPDLYLGNVSQLQIGGTVEVYDSSTSGEVEYVLLVDEREVFVAIGSDHTDRELERHSIPKAKRLCPKVISRQVWPLSDLLEQWDDLRLRSFVRDGNGWTPYQDGLLAMLIRPESLQQLPGDGAVPGTVIFSGTLPVVDGRIRHAPEFAGELVSPGSGVLSRFRYAVNVRLPPAVAMPSA